MNCSGRPGRREANVSQPPSSTPAPRWDQSTPRTADVAGEADAGRPIAAPRLGSPAPPSGLQPIHPQPLSPLGWHESSRRLPGGQTAGFASLLAWLTQLGSSSKAGGRREAAPSVGYPDWAREGS